MRPRLSRFTTLLLALLLAASSCWPTPGGAEAQMRCAGASPRSAPCARAEVPAGGLTDRQVYRVLMSCCRCMGGCTTMRDCPMRHPARSQQAHGAPATDHAALSARRCLVSFRAASPVPATLAVRRARWLLMASPALAPPTTQAVTPPASPCCPPFWTYSPVLSPHAAPALHGLRAPPAV